jgi:hypothetical protein
MTVSVYVVPVVISDQIVIRVYRGDNIMSEIPLRSRRQALVLGAQLVNLALLPEYEPAGTDQRLSDSYLE